MDNTSTVVCHRRTVRPMRGSAAAAAARRRRCRVQPCRVVGGKSPAVRPRRECECVGRPTREGGGPGASRKAAGEVRGCPYRRPTQVGTPVEGGGERVIPPQGTRQTAPVTSGEGGPRGV